MNDIELDDEMELQLKMKYIDMKIQAAMFDMDVDWETWSLLPKDHFKTEKPIGLQRWIEAHADKHADHINQGFDGKQGERDERQAA